MKIPGDDCFKKSTESPLDTSKNCVSVARSADGVFVRDTKDPGKTTLSFTHDEWSAFVGGVRKGEFDV